VKSIGLYPRVQTDTAGTAIVSLAGAVGLVETVRVAGLDRALSQALMPWRKPQARHDPGKIITDLALSLAVGGDCLADVAVLRDQPGVFGPVASDPTVSRLIDTLAADAAKALAAINTARAAVRARVWSQAGDHAPNHAASIDDPLIVDLDATLLTSHSDKEHAAPTFKRGFGFHPLLAFADHGQAGTGEPLSFLLRKGNAGSNTAADHITVLDMALAALPVHARPRPGPEPGTWEGPRVLARSDSAGATHAFADACVERGVGFSFGFPVDTRIQGIVDAIPEQCWHPAIATDGDFRDGAWVAEATGMIDLSTWPAGSRLILRKERPHPGAQLTFTDVDGMRVTAVLTNTVTHGRGTVPGQAAGLELRHRQHARVEDRIREAKATGLRNLPCRGFNENQAWLETVLTAVDLVCWTKLICFAEVPELARCEIATFRYRVLHVAARLTHGARRVHLRIDKTWRWATRIAAGFHRLRAAFG
jgi:hypothetical protein